jgi:hypothetical protein
MWGFIGDHIHLDTIFNILLLYQRNVCAGDFYFSYDGACVHIYKMINLFYLTKGKGVVHGVSW